MPENIFRPKFFTVLKKGYTRKQLVNDSIAGIIVGIVALPLAIAFAVASGVSPEKGLITAVAAGFIISLLGGSRVQIGGPTGAFIVIVYAIVEKYGVEGLVISTVMAGIILVLFGVLRLGSLLKFIPHPLIVGFTSGIAIVIFTSQIKDAFGLEIQKLPSDFMLKWGVYFTLMHTLNISALLITIFTIIIIFISVKLRLKIPGSFIAIIMFTLIVQLFKLPVNTIETLFGEIPRSFDFVFPEIKLSYLSVYFSPAITIALLGGIESLLSAVVADGMIGGNHRSNTELVAQGIANIITPFIGGIPATGAIARTATNVKNGGRTPVAGMVHALTLLLIMLVFGKWAKLIPMSCLAGILIVVAYNMSEWRNFVSVLKGSVFDIIVLLTTFILTVLVDLTVAIEIGIVLSSLLFMKRMADINQSIPGDVDSDIIDKYEDIPDNIGIYEISGPFFFASAKQYAETLIQMGVKRDILIIRMRHVPFIDNTGCRNLKNVIKILNDQGTRVFLSGVKPSVMQELKKQRIIFLIGKSNIFNLFDDALIQAVNQVNNKNK